MNNKTRTASYDTHSPMMMGDDGEDEIMPVDVDDDWQNEPPSTLFQGSNCVVYEFILLLLDCCGQHLFSGYLFFRRPAISRPAIWTAR